MNKIGVFYGSTTGTTEDLARRIAEKLDVPSADVFDVSKLTEALVNEYDVLVLGSSTWGAGELQDDWYDGVKVLKKCDLSHKSVALFGCGDSDSYSDTFCDAIGILYEDLKDTHCKFCGATGDERRTCDCRLLLRCNERRSTGTELQSGRHDRLRQEVFPPRHRIRFVRNNL